MFVQRRSRIDPPKRCILSRPHPFSTFSEPRSRLRHRLVQPPRKMGVRREKDLFNNWMPQVQRLGCHILCSALHARRRQHVIGFLFHWWKNRIFLGELVRLRIFSCWPPSRACGRGLGRESIRLHTWLHYCEAGSSHFAFA
jgi:hypothetical protein